MSCAGSILGREKKGDVGGTLRSHTRPSGKLIHRLYFVVLLRLVKTRGVCFGPHDQEVQRRSCATMTRPGRAPEASDRSGSSFKQRRGGQRSLPTANARRQTQGEGRRWPLRRRRWGSGMPHMLKTLPAVQLGFFLPSMEEPWKIEGLLCPRPFTDYKKERM